MFKRFRVLPALLFLLFELDGGIADVLRGSAGFLLLSLCRLHHVAVDAIRMLRTTAGKQRDQTTEGPESKQHTFNQCTCFELELAKIITYTECHIL